jgi:GTP cyclohydrolase I
VELRRGGFEGLERLYPPEQRVDRPRIERAVREILAAIGEDPEREGLRGTPWCVAETYGLLLAGLGEDTTRRPGVGF